MADETDTLDLFDQRRALQVQQLGGKLLVAVRFSKALKDELSFHIDDDVREVDAFFRNLEYRSRYRELSLIWISGGRSAGMIAVRVPVKATMRSTIFSSCRTLPGHSYPIKAFMTWGAIVFISSLCVSQNCEMKRWISSGMSSRRSRKGGILIGMTFSR